MENALVDRRMAPTIGPLIHTEYADNFESYAYREDLVTDAAQQSEGRLNDAGLPTHGVIDTRGGDSLGWHFCPTKPILGVSVRGMWKLRLNSLTAALGQAASRES